MHDANAAFVEHAWLGPGVRKSWSSPLPVLFNWLGTVLGAILWPPLPTVVLSKMGVRNTTDYIICVYLGTCMGS